jgi:ketosteroid isomerase-like protein
MKRALLLAATMCIVSLFASAQANPEETAIRQIEQDWANANLKADTAALDRIVAADFVGTDPDGQMMSKAQYLADLKSGALKFDSLTLNDVKVRILGDAAIVHVLDTEKSSYKGKGTSGQYRWTDVFVKRGGRWVAVTSHGSKVATP